MGVPPVPLAVGWSLYNCPITSRLKSCWWVLALLLAGTARAQESVTVGLPIGSDTMGVPHQRLIDVFDRVFSLGGEKLGVPVRLKIVPAYELQNEQGVPGSVIQAEQTLDWLRQKKADFLLVSPEDFFLHEDFRKLAEPAYTWSIDKKSHVKSCLFVRGGAGVNTAADLKGKTLNNPWDYVTLRAMLAEHGVDAPPQQHFGGFTFLADPVSALNALVDGDVDAVYLHWFVWRMSRALKPEYRDVTPVLCLDSVPNVFIVARNDMDPDLKERATMVVVNSHRDPDFRPVRWFFAAFDGQFVRVDEDYLKDYRALWAKAEKKGWVKEAHAWFDTGIRKAYREWVKGQ